MTALIPKILQLTFALVAALILLTSAPAEAQEGDWLRWGSGNTTGGINASTGYDREFIREWEKNPPKGFPTVSAANIGPMTVAIKRYEEIVKAGGWQPIPDVKPMDGKSLQPGQTSPAVALVAARLVASGDLEGEGNSTGYFDGALEKAVKRFQASNGLTPTGIVDDRTATAMSVPADARLKQLKANLPRVAELSGSRPKKYGISKLYF